MTQCRSCSRESRAVAGLGGQIRLERTELWVSDIAGANKKKLATGQVLGTGTWALACFFFRVRHGCSVQDPHYQHRWHRPLTTPADAGW